MVSQDSAGRDPDRKVRKGEAEKEEEDKSIDRRVVVAVEDFFSRVLIWTRFYHRHWMSLFLLSDRTNFSARLMWPSCMELLGESSPSGGMRELYTGG